MAPSLLSPPGLSDTESATASRERRRVALAARVAVEEVQHVLQAKLDEFARVTAAG